MNQAVLLQEHGPWVQIDARTDDVQALAALGRFEVEHRPSATRLRALSFVGTVTAGELQVHIEPKVGIPRLLFLLGYAQDPHGWRQDQVILPHAVGLLPAVAAALAIVTRRTLTGGVLHGYRRTEDRLPVLRGRFYEAAQISAGQGLSFPLSVVYDEYTADIIENRTIKTAIRRVMRLRGIAPTFAAELRRLDTLLDEVATLPNATRIPPIRWDRRNARYRSAVEMARLVLAATSWESGHGGIAAAGFLFDMNKVFEDFLAAALGLALRRHGGSVQAQPTSYLDNGATVRIRPDLVWHAGSRRVVIDAKYKESESNDDIYQIVAYCTALSAMSGHLVDVAGPSALTTTVVRNSPIRVHRWHLDLTVTPEHLLEQVEVLADGLAMTTLALANDGEPEDPPLARIGARS